MIGRVRLLMCWVGIGLACLCTPVEAGGPYSGPEPLAIPFGAGQAKLDARVVEVLDQLAIRAQHCAKEGELVFQVRHMPGADPKLLLRREAAIRARLDALGLSVKMERLQFSIPTGSGAVSVDPDEEALPPAPPPPPWYLEGAVRAGEDDFCFEGQDTFAWTERNPRLLAWVRALEQSLRQKAAKAPSFWQLITPSVRRAFLSPSLAREAYALSLAGRPDARGVFWWLVDQDAVALPPAQRLEWVRYLWQAGADEDLSELSRRLAIPGISLDDRVVRAPILMEANLPWPVIERRLMEEGLMRRAGEVLRPTFGQRDSRLIMTESMIRRPQWAAWARLTRAAGAARACFLSDAISLTQPDRVPESDAHLASAAFANLYVWVAGPAGRFEVEPPHGVCNPTADLLRIATGCNSRGTAYPEFASRWLEAGLILDERTIAVAISPGGLDGDGRCRLQYTPGQRFPYRLYKP
ncbi:hypothetical protein [Inhella gelatinilytica]|uniref:Uncharacterized protein n=1 Tax=Inhella gelatinilytica TaxID=2795030 RepID=A0A931IWP5_9BURK|nr:hypothetical protein [Inhella gelatinilytica]MBH9553287.1 hypothetical protein [Inhella gelatinilytica]